MDIARRRQEVLRLHRAGWSMREIGQQTGVSHQTVKRDLDKLRQSGALSEGVTPVTPTPPETSLESPSEAQDGPTEELPPALPVPSEAEQDGAAKAMPLMEMDVFRHEDTLYGLFLKRVSQGDMMAAKVCITMLEKRRNYLNSPKYCDDHVSQTEFNNAVLGQFEIWQRHLNTMVSRRLVEEFEVGASVVETLLSELYAVIGDELERASFD